MLLSGSFPNAIIAEAAPAQMRRGFAAKFRRSAF
jgi:hypothetical protein